MSSTYFDVYVEMTVTEMVENDSACDTRLWKQETVYMIVLSFITRTPVSIACTY